ncbi:MAG: DUF4878 domain-containing protein [Bryobacteraceae bacterium]
MKRDQTAKLLTLVLMLLGLALILVRQKNVLAPQVTPQARTPQDAVYAMLDAARAGNVRSYRESFTGSQAKAVSQALGESTEEQFAAYLKRSHADIKGIAMMEPRSVNEQEVRVRVEYVFADRNEAQEMVLVKADGRWKIASIAGAERVPTTVPYGTPVR